MKILVLILLLIALNSCYSSGYLFENKQKFSIDCAECYNENNARGICFNNRTLTDEDGNSEELWIMVFQNPTEIKSNSEWIIAKSNIAYFISNNSKSPTFIKKYSSKHYSNFQTQLQELNIPDSLYIFR